MSPEYYANFPQEDKNTQTLIENNLNLLKYDEDVILFLENKINEHKNNKKVNKVVYPETNEININNIRAFMQGDRSDEMLSKFELWRILGKDNKYSNYPIKIDNNQIVYELKVENKKLLLKMNEQNDNISKLSEQVQILINNQNKPKYSWFKKLINVFN